MKSIGIIAIVGAKYHNISQRHIKELEGEDITFIREPSNKFDPNAIMAYGPIDGTDAHIGYIPAPLAKKLAPQMDAGAILTGTVTSVIPEKLALKAELFIQNEADENEDIEDAS